MSLESNMMVAAEACFEMDPTPIHEAWFERVFLCNICATRDGKKCLVQHLCNTQNITKHSKTLQNKNSGKPLFFNAFRYLCGVRDLNFFFKKIR